MGEPTAGNGSGDSGSHGVRLLKLSGPHGMKGNMRLSNCFVSMLLMWRRDIDWEPALPRMVARVLQTPSPSSTRLPSFRIRSYPQFTVPAPLGSLVPCVQLQETSNLH